MKKLLYLGLGALLCARVSNADTVTFNTTCNLNNATCAEPADVISQPGFTVSFGADTFEFLAPAATSVVQELPSSFTGHFDNGGGFALLLDNFGNVLADGTFLPGAFSHEHGGVDVFQGSIQFFYLNAQLLGISQDISQGTGFFNWNRDVNLADALDATDFYTLTINGTPATPTPDPKTAFLLLTGLAVVSLAKIVSQGR